jgi:hypothetical protein
MRATQTAEPFMCKGQTQWHERLGELSPARKAFLNQCKPGTNLKVSFLNNRGVICARRNMRIADTGVWPAGEIDCEEIRGGRVVDEWGFDPYSLQCGDWSPFPFQKFAKAEKLLWFENNGEGVVLLEIVKKRATQKS